MGRADGPDYDDPDLLEDAQCLGLQMDHTERRPEPVPDTSAPYALWPEHDAAAGLFMACVGQLGLSVGMGGAVHSGCRASDVRQEAQWLGLEGEQQAQAVAQYRVVEREALKLLNER